MLEREEDGDDFDGSDPMAEAVDRASDAGSEKISTQESTYEEPSHSGEGLDEADWGERIPSELPVDTAWEDIYQTSASSLPSNDDDEWDFTSRTSSGVSLQSHLLWQLNLAPMSDTDRLIATTLIDCINDQGYLEESLQEIVDSFDPELEIELDEVEVVLRRVQQFELPGSAHGICANACSCSCASSPDRTPWLSEAQRLVSDHLTCWVAATTACRCAA